MNRKYAAEIAQETVVILEQGSYLLPTGEVVHIAEELRRAVDNTQSYPPEARLPSFPSGGYLTQYEVCNDTTLAAAEVLVREGLRVAALNFASAKNPGGGFLTGSQAQEESLARSSGLYACIQGNPMYRYHRSMRSCLYSDYVLYSPEVPVIRRDSGELLKHPYLCSFLTSPAVNAGVVRSRREATAAEILEVMRARIHKVLAIAAFHQHDALVLGAWGCGVFKNDPATIASLFEEQLKGPFAGVFARVVFAVLDTSRDQRIITPFLQVFAHNAPTYSRRA